MTLLKRVIAVACVGFICGELGLSFLGLVAVCVLWFVITENSDDHQPD